MCRKPLLGPMAIIFASLFSGLAGAAQSDSANALRKTMTEVIESVGDIPEGSVHRWLRDASRLLGNKVEGVPFVEAVGVAQRQNLPLIEGWENGSAIHRRFRLAKSLFTLGEGKIADAYLFFSSRNKE